MGQWGRCPVPRLPLAVSSPHPAPVLLAKEPWKTERFRATMLSSN